MNQYCKGTFCKDHLLFQAHIFLLECPHLTAILIQNKLFFTVPVQSGSFDFTNSQLKQFTLVEETLSSTLYAFLSFCNISLTN